MLLNFNQRGSLFATGWMPAQRDDARKTRKVCQRAEDGHL